MVTPSTDANRRQRAASGRTGLSLPRRIWIVGPCGSGKSTLADRLAALLGLTATHLDDLFWKPGWVASSQEGLSQRVAPIVAGVAWVIDGNYQQVRQRYTTRVELYVWLDLPLRVTLRRLLWRGLARSLTRRRVCNGNYETLRGLFASRDSILLYGCKTHRGYRERYRTELANRPHVRLRSERQVDAWLRDIADSRRDAPA